jgi:iron complex transport system ATP-binding protein
MSGRGPSLVYRSVSAGYTTAVTHDLTLEVAGGEIVGLVGPNGVGKTTCLRAASGAARVFAGSVEVLGKPVARYGARALASAVGVLPQGVHADFAFSAREFVEMGRTPRLGRFATPGEVDAAVVDSVLERTDTLSLADMRVDTVSGGDLQRLALAQVLAQEPSVLLLDEPTSHLDLNHALQILDHVRDLADDGMAVLGVFHDLDLASRYSDRIAVMDGGTLVAVGPPEVVLTAEIVSDVFGVRALVGRDDATGSVTVSPLAREADVTTTRTEQVLVVGGSGSAAWLLRRLSLEGLRVTLAATNVGDTDHEVAAVLGIDTVSIPPYKEMTSRDEQEVGALATHADVVVVCGTPFGRGNVGNLRASLGAGTRAILVGEMAVERDFTGGEATAIWSDALARGARGVRTLEEALRVVKEMCD